MSFEIIHAEYLKAKEKWPGWPVDPVHAAAVLAEEAGEVIKAALKYCYEDGDGSDITKEAAQVGAMALRMIDNIDKYKRIKSKGVIL